MRIPLRVKRYFQAYLANMLGYLVKLYKEYKMTSILSVILVAFGFLAVFTGLLLVHLKRRKIGIILFLVYVATYVPFSITGRYVIGNHGGSDWRKEWCPQYLMCEYWVWIGGRTKTGHTRYGTIYLPCILLDRCLWHPTQWSIEG